MDQKTLWIGLLVAGVGVAAYAGFRSPPAPESATREPPAAPAPTAPEGMGALPPGHPPMGGNAPGAGTESLPPGHPPMGGSAPSGTGESLPPGHPPIGGGAGGMGAMPPGMGAPPPSGDAVQLTWTAPARWKEAPNPSSMRIATYKVPHVGSDTEDADVSVSMAGGGTAANADRWIAQFDAAAQKTAKKTERTSAGYKTTIVEVEGTLASDPMMGGGAATKSGWGMTGAIVETPGMAHFFKITGPAATVKSAKAELDALLSSLKPK